MAGAMLAFSVLLLCVAFILHQKPELLTNHLMHLLLPESCFEDDDEAEE